MQGKLELPGDLSMSQNRNAEPIDYGMYPFWFWNGDMSESETRWPHSRGWADEPTDRLPVQP